MTSEDIQLVCEALTWTIAEFLQLASEMDTYHADNLAHILRERVSRMADIRDRLGAQGLD